MLVGASLGHRLAGAVCAQRICGPHEPLLLALPDCTTCGQQGRVTRRPASLCDLLHRSWGFPAGSRPSPDTELLPQASSCCTWTKTTASKWTWTSSSRVSRCPRLALPGSRGWGLEPEPSPMSSGSPAWGRAVPQAPAPLLGDGAVARAAPWDPWEQQLGALRPSQRDGVAVGPCSLPNVLGSSTACSQCLGASLGVQGDSWGHRNGAAARMSPAPAGTGDRGWQVKALPQAKLLARGCCSRSSLQAAGRGVSGSRGRGCSP